MLVKKGVNCNGRIPDWIELDFNWRHFIDLANFPRLWEWIPCKREYLY